MFVRKYLCFSAIPNLVCVGTLALLNVFLRVDIYIQI